MNLVKIAVFLNDCLSDIKSASCYNMLHHVTRHVTPHVTMK